MSGSCGRSSESLTTDKSSITTPVTFGDEAAKDVEISYAAAVATKNKTDKPLHINDADFEKLVKNESTPVLIDFWAPWCRPCRMMGPIIDDLAKEYAGRVIIAKMNVDKNSMTPRKFKIRGIPTILVFKDGKLVHRLVGYRNKSEFTSLLNKLLSEKKKSI